jgi:hypothetical protein
MRLNKEQLAVFDTEKDRLKHKLIDAASKFDPVAHGETVTSLSKLKKSGEQTNETDGISSNDSPDAAVGT